MPTSSHPPKALTVLAPSVAAYVEVADSFDPGAAIPTAAPAVTSQIGIVAAGPGGSGPAACNPVGGRGRKPGLHIRHSLLAFIFLAKLDQSSKVHCSASANQIVVAQPFVHDRGLRENRPIRAWIAAGAAPTRLARCIAHVAAKRLSAFVSNRKITVASRKLIVCSRSIRASSLLHSRNRRARTASK